VRQPCAIEAREHAARDREPERPDELVAQQPQRHRVEEQGSLPGEADDALPLHAEEVLEVEVGGAHLPP
jgi:hypothetical protein